MQHSFFDYNEINTHLKCIEILRRNDDAINMSRRLSKELGIGVGISSGANFLGSILFGKTIKKPVVTVFADDNKKYLSTGLIKNIDTNNELVSNKIKLISYDML